MKRTNKTWTIGSQKCFQETQMIILKEADRSDKNREVEEMIIKRESTARLFLFILLVNDDNWPIITSRNYQDQEPIKNLPKIYE